MFEKTENKRKRGRKMGHYKEQIAWSINQAMIFNKTSSGLVLIGGDSFRRSWVWILAPYGHDIFHID